jgi:hypothetical protein
MEKVLSRRHKTVRDLVESLAKWAYLQVFASPFIQRGSQMMKKKAQILACIAKWLAVIRKGQRYQAMACDPTVHTAKDNRVL